MSEFWSNSLFIEALELDAKVGAYGMTAKVVRFFHSVQFIDIRDLSGIHVAVFEARCNFRCDHMFDIAAICPVGLTLPLTRR